jgi:hypothetical protein
MSFRLAIGVAVDSARTFCWAGSRCTVWVDRAAGTPPVMAELTGAGAMLS